MHALPADELAAWLRLCHTPGLSRTHVRRLLQRLGGPLEVVESPSARLKAVAGEAVAALLHDDGPAKVLAARATTWLQAGTSESPRALIPLGDPRYPPALLQTPDPPLLLWAEGRVDLLHAPSLAMVGTRHPTAQGVETARGFAHILAEAGMTIVSGLALGIDGAAHEGARHHAAGTVAVVGTGLDEVYPRRHQRLAEALRVQGLLLSEYPLGSPPRPEHFPQRNRIIAGLGLGTLVVEAAVASGSLITARQAVDCGREVFAIPGSIHSPQSKGCHVLIRQGAQLVESAGEVLDALPGWQGRVTATGGRMPHAGAVPNRSPAPPGNDPLWEAMAHDPVGVDALSARTGQPPEDIQAQLLQWELEGQVARLPGLRFQRVSRG